MLNNNKIRLMSRLALYDKKFGAVDRKKSEYFKWDYIYFRNFWTRLGVFFGCLIISLFYALNKLLVEQADILTLDLKLEGTKIVFFTVAALVVYTIIGTAVAKNEYKKSKERLDAYFSMLDKLDKIYENEKGLTEELSDERQQKTAENYGYTQPYRRREQTEQMLTEPDMGLPVKPLAQKRRQPKTQYVERNENKTFNRESYSRELTDRLNKLMEARRSGSHDGVDGEDDI